MLSTSSCYFVAIPHRGAFCLPNVELKLCTDSKLSSKLGRMSSARPSAMPRGKVENPPMQRPRKHRASRVSQRQGDRVVECSGQYKPEDPVPRLGTPSASVPPDRWMAPASPLANLQCLAGVCIPKLHLQSCPDALSANRGFGWVRISQLLPIPLTGAFPKALKGQFY